jgi:hypothetical protein
VPASSSAQNEAIGMKSRMRLALVGAAVAVAVLGATQLGWASGTARKTTLTPAGNVAFATFKDILVVTGTPAAPTVVAATSSLDQGAYVIEAKVIAFGGHSFARVVCQLRYPGWSGSIATTDQSAATVGSRAGAAEDQTLSLLWAATFVSSGSVQLVCWPEERSGPRPSISDASLVVRAVTSITS